VYFFCSDSDCRFDDQNVMCMRSGLVIKTTPTVRSASYGCQSEGSVRYQGMSNVLSSTNLSQVPHGADGCNGDGNDSNACNTGTKPSSKSTLRYRSVDYLPIVTRFYMMQRTKASNCEPAVTLATDNDYRYWLDVDQNINAYCRSVSDTVHYVRTYAYYP
jgi:hypothetical protein